MEGGVVGWAFDIMHPMAIDASRHIGIAFPEKCATVYALAVKIVDFGMAALAGMRNAGGLLAERSNVMRTMAIGTDGSFALSRRQCGLMDAIERSLVLVLVAPCAGAVEFK